MYPYFCEPLTAPTPRGLILNTFKRFLMSSMQQMNKEGRSILYIIDLPAEQAQAFDRQAVIHKTAYALEEKILRSFDILCVFNQNMRKALTDRYDLCADKFVEFEILDYGVDFSPKGPKRFIKGDKWRIAYAGNLDRRHVGDLNELPQAESLRYIFLGKDRNWILDADRPDIECRGLLTHAELAHYLFRNAHFGLIAVGDMGRRYYDFTCTSKFGAYMSAGLPALVSSKYTYVASLVMKYRVGLVFENLSQLPSLLDRLSESVYMKLSAHCVLLGEKMRCGHFFKRAVNTAISKLN
jgi:hypothetical protein